MRKWNGADRERPIKKIKIDRERERESEKDRERERERQKDTESARERGNRKPEKWRDGGQQVQR